MGFFSRPGTGSGQSARAVAGVFALAGIALASFLAGSWAASSGVFTLRPLTVSAPHPNNMPAPAPGKPCPMMSGGMPMRGGMPMPSGMPMAPEKMMPNMPTPNMPTPNMPTPGKTG